MFSRSRDRCARSLRASNNAGEAIFVKMKPSASRRPQGHVFGRFHLLHTANSDAPFECKKTRAPLHPLNPLQELCSAHCLGENSEGAIFAASSHGVPRQTVHVFFCVAMFSHFELSQMGPRIVWEGSVCAAFAGMRRHMPSFCQLFSVSCVMIVDVQFQAMALPSMTRTQNCWRSCDANVEHAPQTSTVHLRLHKGAQRTQRGRTGNKNGSVPQHFVSSPRQTLGCGGRKPTQPENQKGGVPEVIIWETGSL